ncbi:hypothetical protein MUP95_01870 [bacterium]|nr:hypothetical protein [bacterium]
MVAMRFDYRDIFRSARLAFSFQRMWIQFVGLLCGYLGYVIFTYLSMVIEGKDLGGSWSRFGLLPYNSLVPLRIGLIPFIIGLFILLFSWLVTSTGVARATYMHLKGNTFYSWREAFSFALRKKGTSVISTPVAIFIMAFFTCLGGAVVGLVARIPYLGELGISLFAIVWFMISLFVIFILMALHVSLLLTPAILATTDDDAFEGIFQSFSTLYSQPWRLILYEILLGMVALLGFGIFVFFAKQGWRLMTTIFIWGMGDKYADLSYAASYLLQTWIYPAATWSKTILGEYSSYFLFTHDFSAIGLPVVMTISSWILAICMVVIGGFILSYLFAVVNVGQCVIFLVLKKKKDDENLLERKDKEEEEEEKETEEKKEEKEEEKKVEKKKRSPQKKERKKPSSK